MERLTIIITLFLFSQGLATSLYGPLVKYIKEKASPKLIPRHDPQNPLYVDFQASWLDIQAVDYERSQVEGILATSLAWYSGITWKPADFNNKTHVVLSSNDLYHPVISIINAVGKLESWHGERVGLYAVGVAVIRTHFRGTIFCNDELVESNSCRLRVATYSAPSDVISFVQPSKSRFDLSKIYEAYYFRGSRFNVTDHSYDIHKETVEAQNLGFEYLDFKFTFEENNIGNLNGAYEALLSFD